LNEALEKFLRDNQATYQNPHGINALLLYYFINKEEISYTDSNNSKYKLSELMTKGAKEFPAKSNTKNDLSKFFEFHLPKKEFKFVTLLFILLAQNSKHHLTNKFLIFNLVYRVLKNF